MPFDDIDLAILHEASPSARIETIGGRGLVTRDKFSGAKYNLLTAEA